MNIKVKKFSIVLLSLMIVLCSFVCAHSFFGSKTDKGNAASDIGYLYQNNGQYQVVAETPIHYGKVDSTLDHPGYFTFNNGIGGFSVDGGNFIITSEGTSKCVNFKLPKTVDVNVISKLTLNFSLSYDGAGRTQLINSVGEWFAFYGVNEDGTIANNNTGFQLTNSNVNTTGNISIELNRDEFKLLANDLGQIHTIQWNYFDNNAGDKKVAISIQSISYEYRKDYASSILYQNNGKYQVVDSIPTYFGTHITPNNGGGDHPGYFTLNGGGIGGLTYLSDGLFFLSTSGAFCSRAVNVTLPYSLNIINIKNIKLTLNASFSRAALVNDASNEWYSLYAVNQDGTIANGGVGINFDNTMFPDTETKTLNLSYDQFKYLADDNGVIKTLQWNFWDSNSNGNGVTFVIQSITYETYSESDYKTATFYDSDRKTVLKTTTGILSVISANEFPLNTSVTNNDGKNILWVDSDNNFYDSTTMLTKNVSLYPVIGGTNLSNGTLYQNNSGMTVTASVPTYFGTHITPSNGGGDHPGYFTLNGGGIGGLTYLDTNNFFLSSGGTFCSQAVNVTLPNSLDISYVKTLTIKLNASHSRANLINDSTNEWFTLYGVNTDGTIANNGVGFEFNNTNIPASGDNTLVLTYDQFKYLADDNGIIKTLQWNYWDNKDGGAVTFVIQSISYEVYSHDEYKLVIFSDTNKDVISSYAIGNIVSENIIPKASTLTGYNAGYSVVWFDESNTVVDLNNISSNVEVSPIFCGATVTSNGTLYQNNSGMTVTASVPTCFGTHITPSNGGGDHPKYFTLGGGGIGGLTYLDTNSFFLSSGGSFCSQAVNVTLPNSLDISYVKTLTIKLSASHSRANLINDSANEWFTLYGVNTDGTIANNGVGFEFNNTNIPASGDNTLVLTYDQFKYLADDNGIIKTLQWNYWDNKEGGTVTFVIQSIRYEVYSQDEYKLVQLTDTDNSTVLSSFLVGNNIPSNVFPSNSTLTGYTSGKSVLWLDDGFVKYDAKTFVNNSKVLNPIIFDGINISNGNFYVNNGSYQVSVSMPTHFGTHFNFEDSLMSHPGYFTENGGYTDTCYIDGGLLFLSTSVSYPSKAINVTFPTALDTKYVKNINISLNASFNGGRASLINDASSEWFTLFGVNTDGTIANNNHGFEFNNSNIPSAGDYNFKLNYEQFKLLTDDNGILQTIQWNFWANGADTQGVTFVIKSISYTVYSEDELKVVGFIDENNVAVGKTIVANNIYNNMFPSVSSEIGYEGGWFTQPNGEGLKVNSSSYIAENTNLYCYIVPRTDIAYSIRVWKQNEKGGAFVDATNDFISVIESKHLQGTTNEEIDVSNVATSMLPTGWHLDNNYNYKGNIVADGSLVIDVYFAINIYTVTFYPNNGEASFTQEVAYNFLSTNPGSVKSNKKVFDKWLTEIDSQPVEFDFESFRITSDINIFASFIDVDPTILGTSITLNESISMKYIIQPNGYEILRLDVFFNSNKYSLTDYDIQGEYFVFTFSNISPQQACDEILIKLYDIDGTEELMDSYTTSVRSYCESLLTKSASELCYSNEKYDAVRKLVVDLLSYCEAAQIYTNYKIGDLATKNLSNEIKSLKSTYVKPLYSKMSKSGSLNDNYRWYDAGVRYSSSFGLYFTVAAVSSDNLSIKVTNDGITTKINDFINVGTKNNLNLYRFYYNGLSLVSFTNLLTVKIYLNNEQVGQTLQYSFDSNVYALAEGDSDYSILLQRAYCYGLQAKIFNDADYYVTTEKSSPVSVDKVAFDCYEDENTMPIGGFWGPFSSDPNLKNGDVTANFLTDEYFTLLQEAGINTFTGTGIYEGQTGFSKTLEFAEKYNMGVFVLDHDLIGTFPIINLATGTVTKEGQNLTKEQFIATISSYINSNALAGWFYGDEPVNMQMDEMGDFFAIFNQVDVGNKQLLVVTVGHDSNNRFAGYSFQEELDLLITETNPKFLVFDFYIFDDAAINGEPNYQGYLHALSTIYNTANEAGVPFWGYLQAGGDWTRRYNGLELDREKTPTEGQFMWNYNTLIAYGAKGICFYPLVQVSDYQNETNGKNFASSGIFGADGSINSWYYYAKKANTQAHACEDVLMNAQNVGIIASGSAKTFMSKSSPTEDYRFGYFSEVIESGEFRQLDSVSGDAIVGCFDYLGGTALYVTNFSVDSSNTITLNFDDNYKYTIVQNGIEKEIIAREIVLELDAGEGILITLE